MITKIHYQSYSENQEVRNRKQHKPKTIAPDGRH